MSNTAITAMLILLCQGGCREKTPTNAQTAKPAAAQPAKPASEAQHRTKARRFFDLVKSKQFAKARAMCEPVMQKMMSEAQLKQTWAELIANVGPLQKIVRIEHKQVKPGQHLYLFVGKYKRAQANVKILTRDRSGKVAMFFITGTGLKH